MESVFLEVLNLTDDVLFVQDIRDGISQLKISRPGPVYIPANTSIALVFSSSVHLSYEGGVIRGLINNNSVTVTIRFGDAYLTSLGEASRKWANYANMSEVMALIANTWTLMPNDTLGAQTETRFLPESIPTLYVPSTSKVELKDLAVGSLVNIRVNFNILPVENNANLELRLWFPAFGGFDLTRGLSRLDNGAGIDYPRIEMFHFFIGSVDVQQTGCYIEIRCSSNAHVYPFGYFITVGAL